MAFAPLFFSFYNLVAFPSCGAGHSNLPLPLTSGPLICTAAILFPPALPLLAAVALLPTPLATSSWPYHPATGFFISATSWPCFPGSSYFRPFGVTSAPHAVLRIAYPIPMYGSSLAVIFASRPFAFAFTLTRVFFRLRLIAYFKRYCRIAFALIRVSSFAFGLLPTSYAICRIAYPYRHALWRTAYYFSMPSVVLKLETNGGDFPTFFLFSYL